ncbi:MAG: hypothetical protein EA380_03415 [Phycisphaeraceae bacterium]|nr:MAG: hypothetical protein EA380_03415 [Phycisphaeraceae bacterium]
MVQDLVIERLFEALVNGDRAWSRTIISELSQQGTTPEQLITDVYWPTYEMVARLYRNDQLTTIAHHMATRLLRTLLDQTAANLTRQPELGRTVFAVCGPTDADELAAEMAVDLMEAAGLTVAFAGGGVATDEILEQVQQNHPDALVIFASAPSDLPEIRGLIDTMQEIGACTNTQVIVGGGVFNRADGLAEEIGADLWATDPADLVEVMLLEPERRATPDQRTVGRKRRAA